MSDGNTLWAWQVQEPDGRWSLVLALFPDIGPTVLINRNREVVNAYASIARAHAKNTKQPLRLAQFDLVDGGWAE